MSPIVLKSIIRAYDRVAARTAGRLLSGPRFLTAPVAYLLPIHLIKDPL